MSTDERIVTTHKRREERLESAAIDDSQVDGVIIFPPSSRCELFIGLLVDWSRTNLELFHVSTFLTTDSKDVIITTTPGVQRSTTSSPYGDASILPRFYPPPPFFMHPLNRTPNILLHHTFTHGHFCLFSSLPPRRVLDVTGDNVIHLLDAQPGQALRRYTQNILLLFPFSFSFLSLNE